MFLRFLSPSATPKPPWLWSKPNLPPSVCTVWPRDLSLALPHQPLGTGGAGQKPLTPQVLLTQPCCKSLCIMEYLRTTLHLYSSSLPCPRRDGECPFRMLWQWRPKLVIFWDSFPVPSSHQVQAQPLTKAAGAPLLRGCKAFFSSIFRDF